MSTANLVHAFDRVIKSINRYGNGAYTQADEITKTTNPIARIASDITDPYAREELIRMLSNKAIREPFQNGPTQLQASNLGLLGEQIQGNDLIGVKDSLELMQFYSSDKIGKALIQSINSGRNQVIDKLINFTTANLIKIPDIHLNTILHAAFQKRDIKNYSDILIFQKTQNNLHAQGEERFCKKTTRQINNHILELLKNNDTPFLTELINFVAKLDTSYYDSSFDDIGLAKIEHFLELEEDKKNTFGFLDLLKKKRTSDHDDDVVTLTEDTLGKQIITNTKVLNEMILERMLTKPKGALNIFAQTLNMPKDKYDIQKDPLALELIEIRLTKILHNKNYSAKEQSNIIRGFRAILKTYKNTLEAY